MDHRLGLELVVVDVLGVGDGIYTGRWRWGRGGRAVGERAVQ